VSDFADSQVDRASLLFRSVTDYYLVRSNYMRSTHPTASLTSCGRATTTISKEYGATSRWQPVTDVAKAYAVCKEADLVLEMVYLLGRMGGDNNRRALTLIIERLGDVNRVCSGFISYNFLSFIIYA
jgi:hypothetical protein